MSTMKITDVVDAVRSAEAVLTGAHGDHLRAVDALAHARQHMNSCATAAERLKSERPYKAAHVMLGEFGRSISRGEMDEAQAERVRVLRARALDEGETRELNEYLETLTASARVRAAAELSSAQVQLHVAVESERDARQALEDATEALDLTYQRIARALALGALGAQDLARALETALEDVSSADADDTEALDLTYRRVARAMASGVLGARALETALEDVSSMDAAAEGVAPNVVRVRMYKVREALDVELRFAQGAESRRMLLVSDEWSTLTSHTPRMRRVPRY